MSQLLPELLLTVLFGTQASFTHPGIILPQKESLSDAELKAIVRKSQKNKDVREVLGYSSRVWKALTETLKSGNDQLMENKHHLLSKIADLASLGRNLLVAREKAQNLAAEEGFEAEIRCLIKICVDKASTPIGPNVDKGNHEKEMKIKQAYKRVLITSLQFLNNLISGNETRKLHLWMHLFGSPTAGKPPQHMTEERSKASPAENANVGSSKTQPKKVATKEATAKEAAAKEAAAKEENEGVKSFLGKEAKERPVKESVPNTVNDGFSSLFKSFNYSYYHPGLFTDIPRILGPSEIEALPMIIQTGIANVEAADKSMQAIRCNILLAQETGRALLRELLVFLGAWEVEEGDFCYKMMHSIVETILLNGLVPFAYESLKDDKDIIIPAQCILLKLLVSVYRSAPPGIQPPKPSKIIGTTAVIPLRLNGQVYVSPKFPTTAKAGGASSKVQAKDKAPELSVPTVSISPPLLDTSIAAYLAEVFRKNVLPNIRKIILQQGAIKSGEMEREEFEWSLWDLDRIYEGLYQFMEMLVVFAEDDEAKKLLLSDMKTDDRGGFVGELVGFLVEMDRIIPRYLQTKTTPALPLPEDSLAPEDAEPQKNSEEKKLATSSSSGSGVGIVERPYDTNPEGNVEDDDGLAEEIYDADEEADTTLTEPEEFSWPHMKKFAVLLLSNLAWKNNAVKDLVRIKGGLHAVLNQCMVDDDNPYIREYAILCIRNLLEGNPKNQEEISKLEAKEVVPSENLAKAGFEAFLTEEGKIGLKKVTQPTSFAAAGSGNNSSNSISKKGAK